MSDVAGVRHSVSLPRAEAPTPSEARGRGERGGPPPNTTIPVRSIRTTIIAARTGANRRPRRLSRGGPPPNTTIGALGRPTVTHSSRVAPERRRLPGART